MYSNLPVCDGIAHTRLQSLLWFHFCRNYRKNKDEDDDDDSEEEEEDSEEEEESEDEQPTPAGQPRDDGPRESAARPEMTRAERREMKKKRAQAKQQEDGEKDKDKEDGEEEEEDDDDTDLVNPNHVTKKLGLSSLGGSGAPRELSRREREQKEKKEAAERYWKVCWIVLYVHVFYVLCILPGGTSFNF